MHSTESTVLFTPQREEDRFLPEGPRVVKKQSKTFTISWVNIQTGVGHTQGGLNLLCPGPPTEHRCLWREGRPGFLLPVGKRASKALIGAEKSLLFWDMTLAGSFQTLATIPDDNPRTIINDGEIVPGGKAIVFGTKDTKFDADAKLANLYLYTVDDNRISLLADKQVCSNGKVFASDKSGLILFDIDTPTRKVVRYRLDVSARSATPDGTALDLAAQPGYPDGMCDCGDGTVIIAFYNPDLIPAGRAVRFNLNTGEAVEEWTTPGSPRVTCPLLVQRPDGVKLILTTAAEGMPPDMRAQCPNAGCLFIADTQFADCPKPEVVRLP